MSEEEKRTEPKEAPAGNASASPQPELKVSEEVNAAALAAAAPDLASNRTGEVVTGGGITQRRSRWHSSMTAFRYVNSLSRDDEVKVRDTDRATSIALLVVSVLTVLSLIIRPFATHRLDLLLVCDLLVGASLMFYVANRFGILSTMPPRQALLAWQLMMGAGFIGVFTTINLAVIIALAVANTPQIDIR
jgi:hypothetical protein